MLDQPKQLCMMSIAVTAAAAAAAAAATSGAMCAGTASITRWLLPCLSHCSASSGRFELHVRH